MVTPHRGPLLDRGKELDELFEFCTQPEGCGLLLVAPTGLGRSELLSSLARKLGEVDGTKVLVLRPGREGSLNSLFTQLGVDTPTGAPELLAKALHEALAHQSGPTVLLADDIERMERPLRDLLVHLSHLDALPSVVWILSTTPTLASNFESSTKRLELQPLDAEELKALAKRFLGGSLETPVLDWLAPRAGGSPRMLKILLDGLRGVSLIETDNVWRKSPGKPLPVDTRDLILSRLRRMGRNPIRLMAKIATMPQPVLLESLVENGDFSPLEVRRGVGILLSKGYLEEDGSPNYVRLALPQFKKDLTKLTPVEIKKTLTPVAPPEKKQAKSRLGLVVLSVLALLLAVAAVTHKRTVSFVVVPTDAKVRLNGTLVEDLENVVLRPGPHLLSAKAKNYKDHFSSFDVPWFAALEPLSLDLERGRGRLNIKSNLAVKATLFLDGEDIGTLPFEGEVQAGTHQILVKRSDRDVQFEETIEVGHEAIVSKTFELMIPAEVIVLCFNVQADVYLDGELRGKTPITVSGVQPGTHYLRLEAPNHEASQERKLILKEGDEMQMVFHLRSIE